MKILVTGGAGFIGSNVIRDLLSAAAVLEQAFPSEKHAQASGGGLRPFFIRHLFAIRTEPEDVLNASAANGAALKEITPPKNRVLFAQHDHALQKGQQFLIGRLEVPIEPADLFILAVGIVVTVLGVADAITGKQHGNTLRKEHSGQKVPRLL